MGKKKIDLALVESLARLGVSQQSIAKAIGYSECGLSNAKSYNSALREALERGYANSEVDILMAMHNKGLGKHYHDPVGPERGRKLGFDGDSRLMIHLDERLTGGNVKKVQLSGDSNAPLLVKSLAELMALGGTEKEQEEGKPMKKIENKE